MYPRFWFPLTVLLCLLISFSILKPIPIAPAGQPPLPVQPERPITPFPADLPVQEPAPRPPLPPGVQALEEVAQLGGIAYDIAVQGNYTYIAFPDRLLVVSTTNPTAPGVVAELQLHSAVEEIGMNGEFVFLSVSDVY